MGCMLPLQTWSTVGRLGGHDWKEVIAQLREGVGGGIGAKEEA